MTSGRTFPPSPRRLGLARRSGLHAASPVLVGGAAMVAVVLAGEPFARAAVADLHEALAGALASPATPRDPRAAASHLVEAVLALASPVLAAAAVAAIGAHLAQTRALWLPRRRIAGAPGPARGGGARVRRAGLDLAGAAVVGGVAFAWLWWSAPRLAALPGGALAGAAVIASALATFAVVAVALGVLDALVRHAERAAALRMTPREKREDERLAAGDPRWRGLRARIGREAARDPELVAAKLVIVGDDRAVVIAWDPRRRPIPERTAVGRGVQATRLVGLARRRGVAIHRDAALATALGDATGAVPEAHWPRLAELVAAVAGRP